MQSWFDDIIGRWEKREGGTSMVEVAHWGHNFERHILLPHTSPHPLSLWLYLLFSLPLSHTPTSAFLLHELTWTLLSCIACFSCVPEIPETDSSRENRLCWLRVSGDAFWLERYGGMKGGSWSHCLHRQEAESEQRPMFGDLLPPVRLYFMKVSQPSQNSTTSQRPNIQACEPMRDTLYSNYREATHM